MLRSLSLVLLLTAVAAAEDWDLTNPPQTLKGKHDRAKAAEIWQKARPTFELALAGKPIAADDLAAALENIEEAVLVWEKSLDREWNGEANGTLAEAIKAWYMLRPRRKLPEPADAEEKARREKAAKKAQKERVRSARKLVMDLCRAQRHEKQLRRCPTCEGRKELRSPLDREGRPCKTCARKGVLPHVKGIVAAHWVYHSPNYRADSRNQLELNRLIKLAPLAPDRLAPFVQSVSITSVEDHDTWVRVRTKIKTYTEPGSKHTTKAKKTFTLFRVGKVWWLYHHRFDREILTIEEEKEPKKAE